MQEERDLPGTQHTTSLCTFYSALQRIPRSEKRKRLSTSYSKRTGICHQQATDGLPKHSHLLCMHDVRGSAACISMKENPSSLFPSQGLFVGECANSEADRVPKAEARSAPVGSLNLAPACLLDSPPRPIAECPKRTPSCVLSPVTVCYP